MIMILIMIVITIYNEVVCLVKPCVVDKTMLYPVLLCPQGRLVACVIRIVIRLATMVAREGNKAATA